MKPNLILLNGMPGIGKSTLSKRYIDEHPLSLNLDVDRLWQAMGSWQEHRNVSDLQKYKFAYSLAEIHLSDGYDVIIADWMNEHEQYTRFEQIAKACGAILSEVVLIAPVDEAIERCKTRARAMGYTSGFRPGGILETTGKEKALMKMHEQMMQVVNTRPNIIKIESEYENADSTYAQLLDSINR